MDETELSKLRAAQVLYEIMTKYKDRIEELSTDNKEILETFNGVAFSDPVFYLFALFFSRPYVTIKISIIR